MSIDIENLLASERTRAGFSSAERVAIWQGVEKTIEATALAGRSAAAASTVHDAAREATGVTAKLASWKIAALVASALVVGAAGGALVHGRYAEPRVVTVDHVVTVTVPATVSHDPPTLPSSTSSSPVAPTRAAPPTQKGSTPAKDPSLARERTLLDMARTAITRGDASAALTAADDHAREFPRGQLAEEREVIAVQALASQNRRAEARARAATFRRNYPNSALGSIVEEAVKESP